MQEVIEKIIEKFSNINRVVKNDEDLEWNRAVYKCTEIVQQAAAEYNNGWIPVSERLPNEKEWLKDDGRFIVTDGNCVYQSIYDIYNEKRFKTLHITCLIDLGYKSNYEVDERVIAWQPLPAPYQTSGDHKKKTNFDMCCESMEAMAQIIDIAKIGWTKEQIIEWLQKEECPVPD